MCRKFSDSGNVIDEFPLIHNKRGLWALTSGAARNGVFHKYREPQTGLEKQLSSMGINPKLLEIVQKIDVELKVGGRLCSHVQNKSGYGYITDGKVKELTEPEYAPANHFNQYHVGCMISTYEVKIYDATYVIHYRIGTHMNGSIYTNILSMLVTLDVNEQEFIQKLKNI